MNECMDSMAKLHKPSPVCRRIAGIAALSLAVLIVGTAGYRMFGGAEYSILDCLYMTVITVLTIGYGEVVDLANNPAGRVFTMFIAAGGIGIIGYALSSVTAFAVGGELRSEWRRWKMDRAIEQLSGHFILCGWSRVASQIASELVATGRGLVVVDPKAAEASSAAGARFCCVDGELGDDEALKQAGVDRAAGLFASADDDPLNIVVCMTARQLNPKLRIVAAVADPRNGPKMRKAGADAVVNAFTIGGLRMASEMVRPAAVSFLDVMLRDREKGLRIEDIAVSAAMEGKKLSDLDFSAHRDSLLVAIRAGESWQFNPPPGRELAAGDRLIVMTTPDGRERLERALGG